MVAMKDINDTLSSPNRETCASLIPLFDQIIQANLLFLLDRYDGNPAYHFIDTKYNTITGEDFVEKYKGRDTIYGWIQGRGLEAVAGHHHWLDQQRDADFDALKSRCSRLIREVLAQMEHIYARNGKRISFLMSRQGVPVRRDETDELVESEIPPQSTYSDLFYCKGVLAAAR